MASKTPIEDLLIGGLPAEKFAGRNIKVDFPNNNDCMCKCLGIDSKRGTIVVISRESGRAVTVHVTPQQCHPWWSNNPELKVLADTKGVTFNGQVSVGRALAEAIKPQVSRTQDLKEVADRTPRYRPPAPAPKVVVVKPEITARVLPDPEPAVAAPVPEPEVEEPDPVIDEPEPEAPPPQSREIRKLVGIEVPLNVPDDWMADYQEFKRIAGSYEPSREEIARLREAIAKLEREQEDNKLLLELHIEQLESKGIILKWDSPQETTGPVVKRSYLSDRSTPAEKIKSQFISWLPKGPDVLTFDIIFRGLDMKDNQLRRIAVKEVLDERGYRPVFSRGTGRPAEFHKP